LRSSASGLLDVVGWKLNAPKRPGDCQEDGGGVTRTPIASSRGFGRRCRPPRETFVDHKRTLNARKTKKMNEGGFRVPEKVYHEGREDHGRGGRRGGGVLVDEGSVGQKGEKNKSRLAFGSFFYLKPTGKRKRIRGQWERSVARFGGPGRSGTGGRIKII